MEHPEELHREGEKTSSSNDWLNALYTTQEDCIDHMQDGNQDVPTSEAIPTSTVDLHKDSRNEGTVGHDSGALRQRVADVGTFSSMVQAETESELFTCQELKEHESSSPRFEDMRTGNLQRYLSERNPTVSLENGDMPNSCTFMSSLVTSCSDSAYPIPEGTQQLSHAFLETMDAAASVAPALVQIPRTRWRPNPQQLTILERHFNSGYTKSTPELFAIVNSAGEAKEAQVTVWLKNRLARSKRSHSSPKVQHSPLPVGTSNSQDSSRLHNDSYSASIKRFKRSGGQFQERCHGEFEHISKSVLTEVSTSLFAISPVDVSLLVSELNHCKRVCCYGVDRELCVMRALTIRLHQMGLDAHLVGELNTPQVGPEDLLIASAGPGFYNTVSAICLAAIRAKAKVIVITYHQTAPVPFADTVIRIPSGSGLLGQCPAQDSRHHQSYGLENGGSLLSLGSGYESTLWMLFECVCLILQRERGMTKTEMFNRTTNLEQQS